MRWKRSCMGVRTVHPVPDSTPSVGAVVLAGGKARRMGGQDKGLVTLQNRPMVTWAVNAVSPVANAVVVNANRNEAAYRATGLDVITDVVGDFPGPLAGLLSACEYFDTEWVLMVPCDSPFITSELIEALVRATVGSSLPIAVAHDGDRLQPVFAIVRRDRRDALRAYLERGERKIDLWYEEEGYQRVDCSAFEAMFDNINTPEELQGAEARLAQPI